MQVIFWYEHRIGKSKGITLAGIGAEQSMGTEMHLWDTKYKGGNDNLWSSLQLIEFGPSSFGLGFPFHPELGPKSSAIRLIKKGCQMPKYFLICDSATLPAEIQKCFPNNFYS